jgi:thymidine kinase
MSLELIIGPMFAGKSSTILQRVKREQCIGTNTLIVTSCLDTRYTENVNLVKTHDSQVFSAVSLSAIKDILDLDEFKKASLIIIEEAQFFEGLYGIVKIMVEYSKKHVIVVGLDGDSERRPFGEILQLVPLCDKVTKLTALCKRCSAKQLPNGTPVKREALFTKCIGGKEGQVCVGGNEKYEAVCREHYLG